MAASTDKLFANIPLLWNEKDWLVWKLKVSHALKAPEQWEFDTGYEDSDAEGHAAKQDKAVVRRGPPLRTN